MPPPRFLPVVPVATLAALVAGAGALGVVGAVGAPRDGGPATPPPPARAGDAGRAPKAADGHYWAEARIDGRPVRVLVDTGASAVALTVADAGRLGLRPERLAFTRRVRTAAGPALAAPVTLDSVAVGPARVAGVHALVVRSGLDASLLGMSFLGRLSGFSADRTGLTLAP